jgi:hypothetical protein
LIWRAARESKDGGLNFVAKIEELTFGSIVVEAKEHRRDVLIFTDSTVSKSKAGYGKESELTGSAIL